MQPAPSQPQPPFAPDPAQASAIIDASCNPYLSLRDIAEAHDITIETLTLFLDRPDIRERLAHIDTVTSRRTQSIAAACLPAVVKSLNRIVEAYLWEESKIVVTPTNFSQLEQRRRAAETTRRAGALLYRLSRPPTPPRPPRPDAPPRAPSTSTPIARENPGISSLGPASSDSEPVAPTPRAASEPVAPEAPCPPSASEPNPDLTLPDFSSVEHFLSHLEQLVANETPDNPITIPEEALAALAALASGTLSGPAP